MKYVEISADQHRKGFRLSPQCRPDVGEACEVSGPNSDDDEGYVFAGTKLLWADDTFCLYGNVGFYPVLNKWEHVIFRPLTSAT